MSDWCWSVNFLNIDTCVMCALHRKSIFLLLLMVKNKKVTSNNTKCLLDSTPTTTNYNDIYNDNNYIYNYIYGCYQHYL